MSLLWSDTLDNIDWTELSSLYQAAGLGNKTPADLEIAFSNSRFKFFVREHGALVAVGRALSDGVDCSYICDVAVLPGHQGRGLGRQVVEKLVGLSRSHRKIILYAVPGKESFYRRLGFRPMSTAMAIFQDQALAQARGYIVES